jgi:hypothetical protein
MHERLRTHAESVAFFGGGKREKAVSCFYFVSVLFHKFKCQLVLQSNTSQWFGLWSLHMHNAL